MAQQYTPQVGEYVIAEVVGFDTPLIRCRVERLTADMACVRTASILDAGTSLTLTLTKLHPIKGYSAWTHRDGLITMGQD